ncbi:MAG: tRNA preQ1(34) S-adenosylmethionine ribosyltransferase-isomerase QueA, partial [Candidatus Aminicenantes bacterium]
MLNVKTRPLLVSDFDYELPAELIAQKPLPKREQSRMMVLHRETKEIIHSQFIEFPSYLQKDNVLVLNATKVIPARVYGQKEGKKIEFLFLKEQEKGLWEVLCRPAKYAQSGNVIFFAEDFEGKIEDAGPEGRRTIRFSADDILPKLKKFGFAPLPPYIKRSSENPEWRTMDLERYQTIFAQKEGAIAAPTAGLHFTPDILKEIKGKDVRIVRITLDVGLATFQPVRAKKTEDHRMLEENYTISPSSSRVINEAKKLSQPVCAVGTTSVRALESASQGGKIQSGSGSTQLFIYPGYQFNAVDRLLTNFHLPRSTLLMMVSAFADLDFI